MGRWDKKPIDHTCLREWLVEMEALDPDMVSTVLEVIRENSGPKRREYAERFFENGESISCIAEQCGVAVSTVSHTIKNAMDECYGWLVSNLPPEALYAVEEGKQPQKKRYLHMSEDEVVVRYRQAKNKAEQIGILADMNVTSKDVIREVLREHGVDVPEQGKKHGRAPQRAVPLREAAARIREKQGPKGGRRKWPDPPMAPMLDVEHEKQAEERIVEKTNAKAMTPAILAKVLEDVDKAFPCTPMQAAAGKPAGALLTVHWNEDGIITETALLIEGAD